LGSLVDEESLLLAEGDSLDLLAIEIGERMVPDLLGLSGVLDGLELVVTLGNRSIN
jgi:hypothetical protein